MTSGEPLPTVRLLLAAARLLENAWGKRLRPLGLTPAGVIILDVVALMGPITQKALARYARVSAQTIGDSLKRLERLGYVGRRPNPVDRRHSLVSITDSGYTSLAKAQRIERTVLADLGLDTSKLRKELQAITRALPAVPPPQI